MKKMDKDYYDAWSQNLDSVQYWDYKTKEFYLDFDEAQKIFLMQLFDEGISASAFAYPDVPVECMRACAAFIAKDYYLWRPWNNVYVVDVWKTARVFKDAKRCRLVLEAISNKVNVFNEFKNVCELTAEELAVIKKCACVGVNICRQVKKQLPLEVLRGIADRKIKRKQFMFRLWRRFVELREG